jgi:hypothetical protein
VFKKKSPGFIYQVKPGRKGVPCSMNQHHQNTLPGESVNDFIGPPHILECDLCGKRCRNPEQTTKGLWACWRCEGKVTLVNVDPFLYRPGIAQKRCFLCHDDQRVYIHFLGDPHGNTVLCCERCRGKILPKQKLGWGMIRLKMAFPSTEGPRRYRPTIRQLNAARLEKIKSRKSAK